MDENRAIVAIAYLQGYLDEAVRIARRRKDWECYTDMDNAVNEAVYRELSAVRDALYEIFLDDDDDKVKDWTGGTVAYARGGVVTPAGGRE